MFEVPFGFQSQHIVAADDVDAIIKGVRRIVDAKPQLTDSPHEHRTRPREPQMGEIAPSAWSAFLERLRFKIPQFSVTSASIPRSLGLVVASVGLTPIAYFLAVFISHEVLFPFAGRQLSFVAILVVIVVLLVLNHAAFTRLFRDKLFAAGWIVAGVWVLAAFSFGGALNLVTRSDPVIIAGCVVFSLAALVYAIARFRAER